MTRARAVPITPGTLAWAIRESGYSREDLAQRLEMTPEMLRGWEEGPSQPNLTQFRKLAATLKRPTALFFLPEPPAVPRPGVEFRHPPKSERTSLNPSELRFLRESARLQRTVSWVSRELHLDPVVLPVVPIGSDPEEAAATVRSKLGVSVDQQLAWTGPAQAFAGWRAALHSVGALVFTLPLGRHSCRGFSIWDDQAPLIATNTWWNVEARIFTMFHEYGHLLTRTNSACVSSAAHPRLDRGDPAERWCERFAAALLLPWPPLETFLKQQIGWRPGRTVEQISDIRRVARRFKVSLRATTLRLIERDVTTWATYSAIPEQSDEKTPGGGGGGRSRLVRKEDEYGARAKSLFLAALDEGLMSRADVLSHLDVSDRDLDKLSQEPKTA